MAAVIYLWMDDGTVDGLFSAIRFSNWGGAIRFSDPLAWNGTNHAMQFKLRQFKFADQMAFFFFIFDVLNAICFLLLLNIN